MRRSETFSNSGTDYGNALRTTETDSYVDGSPSSVTHQAALFADSNWNITSSQDETDLDGHGRPVKKTVFVFGSVPANEITTYHWSNAGTLTSLDVPDPSQNDASVVAYSYSYDSLGRATSMSRPDGGPSPTGVAISYDGLTQTRSEVVGSFGGLPAVTITTNDAFGRLVRVDEQTSPSPLTWVTTLYEPDESDAIDKITDPQGVVTKLAHDFAGRRTQITRGTRVWTYGYDKNGDMTSVTTPCTPMPTCAAAYTTTIAYDNLGEVSTKLIAPRDLTSTDRAYFGVDHELYEWDYLALGGGNRKGNLRNWYTYAPSTSTAKVLWHADYDAQGHVVALNNTTGDSLGGYGALSRGVSWTYAMSGAVAYHSFHEAIENPNNNFTDITISFDRRGLPTKGRLIPHPLGGQDIAVTTRNVAGLATKQRTNETGTLSYIESNWTYDPLGRVTSQLVQSAPGTTKIVEQDLAYLGNDDPSSLDHWLGAANHKHFAYEYDARHQLKGVSETALPNAFTAGYDYGDAGRFKTATESAAALPGSDVKARDVTYHYDGIDPEQVTSLTVGTSSTAYATYTYDLEGNQTSVCYGPTTSPMCAGDSVEYLYDGKDQLRRATKKANGVAQGSEEYWYDQNGARILTLKRDSAGNKTELIWFVGDAEAHYDATGAVTHIVCNVSLGNGPTIARIDRAADESTKWEFMFHGLGNSTLAAVDRDSGLVDASFDYAPFGEIVEATDAGGAGGAGIAAHRHRMNDKFVDEISNLSYYGARCYDKTLIGWTQGDPLYRFAPDAGLLSTPRRANLYTFSLQNPLKYLDPDGLDIKGGTTDGGPDGSGLGTGGPPTIMTDKDWREVEFCKANPSAPGCASDFPSSLNRRIPVPPAHPKEDKPGGLRRFAGEIADWTKSAYSTARKLYHAGMIACAVGSEGACEAVDAVDGAIEEGISTLTDLIAPGASGKRPRSPNQTQNILTDRLAKRYGLNAEQSRLLHDEVSRQGLTDDEIDQAAQDISKNMPKGNQSDNND